MHAVFSLILAAALSAVSASAIGQDRADLTYLFFFSGPGTVSVNAGPAATGTVSITAQGYGYSNAGSGPGFMVETVPLQRLSISGPGNIGGVASLPGVFRQQNVDPFRYQVLSPRSMSIDGVTFAGYMNLPYIFGSSKSEGLSCIDCTGAITTTGGSTIDFQFASGPGIAASVFAIPEPGSVALFAGGLAMLGFARASYGRKR